MTHTEPGTGSLIQIRRTIRPGVCRTEIWERADDGWYQIGGHDAGPDGYSTSGVAFAVVIGHDDPGHDRTPVELEPLFDTADIDRTASAAYIQGWAGGLAAANAQNGAPRLLRDTAEREATIAAQVDAAFAATTTGAGPGGVERRRQIGAQP